MAYPQTAPAMTLPIPVKGMNARDPLANMSPEYAPWILNFEPEPQYLKVRRGWRLHADLTTETDESLCMTAYGESGLFVYGRKTTENNKIWDVTDGTPAAVSVGGPTDDDDVTVQALKFAKRVAFITNTASVDCSSVLSDTTWTLLGFTESLTAVDGLVGTSYRGRVYLFNGTDMYYSALAGVTGAMSKIELETVFDENAIVAWAGVLTDSTNKPTETMLAIGNAAGEIVVYAGDYPAATNWEMVARVKTAPPLFYNCIIEYHGDVWVTTAIGVVSVRNLLSQGSNGAYLDVSVSEMIGPYWRQLVSAATSGVVGEYTWGDEDRIDASNETAVSYFGFSVAINEDWAIVGSIYNSTTGAVYFIQNVGGTWGETQTLTPSDAPGAALLGWAVAIDGSTAVAGAYQHTSYTGAVYIYTETGGTWSEAQILTGNALGDNFGASVAIYDDIIVVGANGAAVTAGEVYVYKKSGATWVLSQTLTASDAAVGAYFGSSVAIDARGIYVGANFANIGGTSQAGAVYFFAVSGGVYSQTQKLTPTIPSLADDSFGSGLSVDGDNLLISTSANGAYVFIYSGSSWVEQQHLLSGTRIYSVAISGSYLMIGNYNDDNVNVFKKASGVWTGQPRLQSSDFTAGDTFGRAVAMYEDEAIIGAPVAAVGAHADAGAIYVYSRTAAATDYAWSMAPTRGSIAYWPEENKIYVMIRGAMIDGVYTTDATTIFIYNAYSKAWIPTVFTEVPGAVSLTYFNNNIYMLTSDATAGRYVWKIGDESWDHDTAGNPIAFNYVLQAAYFQAGNFNMKTRLIAVEPIIETDFAGTSVIVKTSVDFGRKTSGDCTVALRYGHQIPIYMAGNVGAFFQYRIEGATDINSTLGLKIYGVGVAIK